jgi:elongation factor G
VVVGLPLTAVKVSLSHVTVSGGSPSDIPVDTYRLAASRALADALQRAGCRLLEPMMKVDVKVEEACVGSILSDLTGGRRAQVTGVQGGVVAKDASHRDMPHEVAALVPLHTMQGYSTALRSMTAGAGTFSMAFSHYGALDTNAEKEALAQIRGY